MSTLDEVRSVDLAGELRRRWLAIVAIILMWIALWGTPSVANILGGAVVAVAVLVLSRSVRPGPVEHFSFEPAVRYLSTFTRQLVVATWDVIKAVVRPDTIRPGIIEVPLEHVSDAVVTLIANSITLTPGTLTLETERRGDAAVLYVHSLDLGDETAVREDIYALEKLALDAFAGVEAQQVQARRLAELEEDRGPVSPDRAASEAEHTASGAERTAASGVEDTDGTVAEHTEAAGDEADAAPADDDGASPEAAERAEEDDPT